MAQSGGRRSIFIRELDQPSVDELAKKLRQSAIPPVVSCEEAGKFSWYLNFDSEETAQAALAALLKDGQTIFGQSVMARLKERLTVPQPSTEASRAPEPRQLASRVVISPEPEEENPYQQPLMFPSQLVQQPTTLSYLGDTLVAYPTPTFFQFSQQPYVLRPVALQQSAVLPPTSRSPPPSQQQSQRRDRNDRRSFDEPKFTRKPQGLQARRVENQRGNGSFGQRGGHRQTAAKTSTPQPTASAEASSFHLQLTSFPPLLSNGTQSNGDEESKKSVTWRKSSTASLPADDVTFASSSEHRQSVDLDKNLSLLEQQMDKMTTTDGTAQKSQAAAQEVAAVQLIPAVKLSYAKMAQKTPANLGGKQRE